MKTNYLSALILLLVSFFIFSCSEDETVLNFEQDINVTIQGIVYDNNGNTPLSGVRVSLGSDSVSTGADGVYVFENNASGSYLLKFEKANYATMVQRVSEGGRDFTADAIVNTSPIFLFEKNQSLASRFVISNGLETRPSANTEVSLEIEAISGDIFFENNIILATTNDNGEILVENLPDQSVELSISFTEGDAKFSINADATPADFSRLYRLNRESLSEFLLVESNVVTLDGDDELEFAAGSNITFNFSSAIDAAFEGTEVTLTKNGGLDVVISTTISGNDLTVDPRGTALEAGEDYRLDLNVKSANGIFYNRSFSFTVAGGEFSLGQVTGLLLDEFHKDNVIAETTTNVIIEFAEVENADFYEVYGRFSAGTNEYVLLNSFTAGEVVDQEDSAVELSVNLIQNGIDVPEDGYFDNSQSFFLIVRAGSGSTFGEFSSELQIREGDGD